MPKTIEIDVTDDELDTIAATLYTMEPPAQQKKGLRDTIAKLEHPIRAMLQKNFTYDGVANVLMSQFKVEELTGATLKRYLSEIVRARLARDEQKVQNQIKRNMAKAKRSLKQSASEVSGQSPAESTKQFKQPKQTIALQPQNSSTEHRSNEPPKKTIAAPPQSVLSEPQSSKPQREGGNQAFSKEGEGQSSVVSKTQITDGDYLSQSKAKNRALFNEY